MSKLSVWLSLAVAPSSFFFVGAQDEELRREIVVLFGGAAAGPLAGLFYGLGVRSDDQM